MKRKLSVLTLTLCSVFVTACDNNGSSTQTKTPTLVSTQVSTKQSNETSVGAAAKDEPTFSGIISGYVGGIAQEALLGTPTVFLTKSFTNVIWGWLPSKPDPYTGRFDKIDQKLDEISQQITDLGVELNTKIDKMNSLVVQQYRQSTWKSFYDSYDALYNSQLIAVLTAEDDLYTKEILPHDSESAPTSPNSFEYWVHQLIVNTSEDGGNLNLYEDMLQARLNSLSNLNGMNYGSVYNEIMSKSKSVTYWINYFNSAKDALYLQDGKSNDLMVRYYMIQQYNSNLFTAYLHAAELLHAVNVAQDAIYVQKNKLHAKPKNELTKRDEVFISKFSTLIPFNTNTTLEDTSHRTNFQKSVEQINGRIKSNFINPLGSVFGSKDSNSPPINIFPSVQAYLNKTFRTETNKTKFVADSVVQNCQILSVDADRSGSAYKIGRLTAKCSYNGRLQTTSVEFPFETKNDEIVLQNDDFSITYDSSNGKLSALKGISDSTKRGLLDHYRIPTDHDDKAGKSKGIIISSIGYVGEKKTKGAQDPAFSFFTFPRVDFYPGGNITQHLLAAKDDWSNGDLHNDTKVKIVNQGKGYIKVPGITLSYFHTFSSKDAGNLTVKNVRNRFTSFLVETNCGNLYTVQFNDFSPFMQEAYHWQSDVGRVTISCLTDDSSCKTSSDYKSVVFSQSSCVMENKNGEYVSAKETATISGGGCMYLGAGDGDAGGSRNLQTPLYLATLDSWQYYGDEQAKNAPKTCMNPDYLVSSVKNTENSNKYTGYDKDHDNDGQLIKYGSYIELP